jgi:hypothetical protein
MRPVLSGHIDMVELHRTNLSLLDFAILNDALDVQAENERRVMEANRK